MTPESVVIGLAHGEECESQRGGTRSWTPEQRQTDQTKFSDTQQAARAGCQTREAEAMELEQDVCHRAQVLAEAPQEEAEEESVNLEQFLVLALVRSANTRSACFLERGPSWFGRIIEAMNTANAR